MRALALAPLLLLSAAAAQPDVVAEATVADPVLDYGEPIRARYTLTNTGTEPYRTFTSSSCVVGFALGPAQHPTVCTADEAPFTLVAGERRHYDWTLDPADLGAPEADGSHTLWLFLGAAGWEDPSQARLAASVTVEAPAYRGGPLRLRFASADAEAVGSLRADVGGEVVQSRAQGDDVYEEWQITGTLLSDAVRRLEDSGLVDYVERTPRPALPLVTDVADGPAGARLSAPAPNPTAGPAALTLRLAASAAVTVDVVDALGRRVAVLHEGPLAGGGDHAFRVEAGALPAGVYVVRVAGGGVRQSQRVVVAR